MSDNLDTMAESLSERETLALAHIYKAVVNDGKAVPSYTELGDVCACSLSYAREITFSLANKGILDGPEGKKPTGFTPEGEMLAAKMFMDVQDGRMELPEVEPRPTPSQKAEQNAVAKAEKAKGKTSLLAAMADRLSLEPDKLLHLLKTQIISVKDSEPPVTNEECAVVLHTMRKYDLDPMVKQIYAFRSRGKLQIVFGYDGWIKIANNQTGYLGIEYEEGPLIDVPNGGGRKVPEYIRGKIHSEGKMVTSFPVFFLEWYNPGNDSNKKRPYHHLRMKCFTQHVREHFGISALDDTDAENLQAPAEASFSEDMKASAAAKRDEMKRKLEEKEAEKKRAEELQSQAEDAEVCEDEEEDEEEAEDLSGTIPDDPDVEYEDKEDDIPDLTAEDDDKKRGDRKLPLSTRPLVNGDLPEGASIQPPEWVGVKYPEPFDQDDDPGPAAPPSSLFDAPAQQKDPMAAIRAELARQEAAKNERGARAIAAMEKAAKK